MVQDIRRALVEYHDLLWEVSYEKTWYRERPGIADFYNWRDLRVLDEIHWFGWFIDYWMEGGLMRDVFTHKLTAPRHWHMLMQPTKYTRAELEFSKVVGDGWSSIASFDPNCSRNMPHKKGAFYSTYSTSGCEPVAVVSAEKLRDHKEGAQETASIANILLNNDKMGRHVIDHGEWDCIWEEVIKNGKGGFSTTTDHDHDSPSWNKKGPNFSSEMLREMLSQLNRLIKKYSSSQWSKMPTALRIVDLLVEHRALLQIELNEVASGVRKLTKTDFLGPKERARRREAMQKGRLLGTIAKGETNESAQVQRGLEIKEGISPEGEGKYDAVHKDYSNYFNAMEGNVVENKRRRTRQLAHLEKNEAARLDDIERQLAREREDAAVRI